MYAWKTLPRGTLRLTMNGKTADVWKMGGGRVQWTVIDDSTDVYLAARDEESVDAACEAALDVLSR